MDDDQKQEVETKIKALEEVITGEDTAIISTAKDALMKVVQEIAAKAYEKAAKAEAGGTEQQAEAPGEDAASQGDQKASGDDSVDADFEVVDD